MKNPKMKINKRKYKYHHHHHRVYSISTVCLVGSKSAKIALASQIFVEPVGLDGLCYFSIYFGKCNKKKIIYHSFVVILKQCRSLIYWV